MTRRFRLLAGPNGSGKTTLKRRLERDYVVNFYDFLASSYDASVKAFFREGAIVVENDCVRFKTSASANSYTVALLTAFLSAEHVRQGMSFSQETVFSLPSWFERLRPSLGSEAKRLPRGTAFETSAEAASREAVSEAFAAGLPITVLQDGRVVRLKGETKK